MTHGRHASARSPRPPSIPRPSPSGTRPPQGKLLVKRCTACGEPHHYPRAICPFCGSDRTEWTEASGRGTIYSYSVMRRAPIPYAIAYVTLDEGPTMMTNIVDCDLDAIRIGQPVRVVVQADRGRSAGADVRTRGLSRTVPFPHSTERFLTTHTGSLPRPADLIRTMYAKEEGVPVDAAALDASIRAAVASVVGRQVEAGVDLVNDGEMSKPSYATYVKDRLSGFGGQSHPLAYRDLSDFPEMAARVFGDPGRSRRRTPACNAAIAVRDPRAAQRDAENLKARRPARRRIHERGLPRRHLAVLPQRALSESRGLPLRHRRGHAPRVRGDRRRRLRGAGRLSRTSAWGATSSTPTWTSRDSARRPSCTSRRSTTPWPACRPSRRACTSAGATTKVRTTTTCRSPTSSTSSSRCGRAAISFEASNPRHAHEWRVFEDVKLPEGKVLIPGVLDSTTNFIEHPDLVAERIGRYAKLVGRENVIAGTDCGFGTWVGQAAVVPDIVWAKLASMAEGARRATKEFWK